jgi:hypothetical protein
MWDNNILGKIYIGISSLFRAQHHPSIYEDIPFKDMVVSYGSTWIASLQTPNWVKNYFGTPNLI